MLAAIDDFNTDPGVDAFIVQLPLPAGLDDQRALNAIDPAKDADGLHPVNLGRLMIGAVGPRPCTPLGIQALLAHHHVPIEGHHVVIVGRGLTIGRPLAVLLSLKEPNANATVTHCHTGTKFLPEYTRQADILIVAAGVAPHHHPRHGEAGCGRRRRRASRWRAGASSPTSTKRAPRSRAGSRPGWAASGRPPGPCCCATPSRPPNARAWSRTHEQLLRRPNRSQSRDAPCVAPRRRRRAPLPELRAVAPGPGLAGGGLWGVALVLTLAWLGSLAIVAGAR